MMTGRMKIDRVEALEPEALDVQQERARNAHDHMDDDVRERPEQVEEQQPEEFEVRDVQLALDDLCVVVEADEFGATLPLRFLSWKSVNDIHLEEQG